MNARRQNNALAPSENWDDDFLFQQNYERQSVDKTAETREPRLSIAHSNFAEDWDNELAPVSSSQPNNVLEDRKNLQGRALRNPLEDWAEPGPSTPSKRVIPHAENWDDDFEDRTESPIRRHSHLLKTRHSYHTPPRTHRLGEPESWDEDFDMDRNDSPLNKRTRQNIYAESSDEEGDLGFVEKEEDKTVTARSRAAPLLRQSPPPPVPALPQSFLGSMAEPFPRSPTVSVFSIPTTSGRDSMAYTSASHLALRPTISGGSLAMLPPSPPIHRERRRLRKKSRPPHLDSNVFELIEERYDPPPSNTQPPSTPPRASSPISQPSGAVSPSSSKTPLLSRIGSVKKWGVRKSRASTGPSEIALQEHNLSEDVQLTPRPTSSLAQSPTSNRPSWFFRTAGGSNGSDAPPLRTSSDLADSNLEKQQPKRPGSATSGGVFDAIHTSTGRKPSRTFHPGSGASDEDEMPSLPSTGRRPTSMQVSAAGPPKLGMRHASYGSSSSKVFFTNNDSTAEVNARPEEGSRTFMGSVRRISLAGQKKHKRTKSSANEISHAQTALPIDPTQDTRSSPKTHSSSLLPPIELQPPSPPRAEYHVTASRSIPIAVPTGIDSLILPSSSVPGSLSRRPSTHAGPSSPTKAPSSPQSASLGRSTQSPNSVASSSPVPRRNSLGDLKIPARISQAQMGLKRDLGMVREFASSVEKLKALQLTYHSLISQIQTIIDQQPMSRATSPTIFNLVRPGARPRSNTNPVPTTDYKQLAVAFYTLNTKYKVSWECAELLIELGGGSETPVSPSISPPVPTMAPQGGTMESRKSRERAITLAGDESKPPATISTSPVANPSNYAWRASTGRHDLSQRQLVLLREMLNTADNSFVDDPPIPEETAVNRQWRWGDPASSTLTLPSENSVLDLAAGKPRKSSKLGMTGLRDMLRSMKRNQAEQISPFVIPSTSPSAGSSVESYTQHHYPHGQIPTQRRHSKTSTEPDSVRSARDRPVNLPYSGTSIAHKASPRRPSLASIFRFGQKSKGVVPGSSLESIDKVQGGSGQSERSSTTEEDEWDRIDVVSDLDSAAKALGISSDGSATIKGKRGRSPYLHGSSGSHRPITPKRTPSTSQTSFLGETSPHSLRHVRSTRLSNVEEHVDDDRSSRLKSKTANRASLPRASPHRSHLGTQKSGISGSVRSAPPQPLDTDSQALRGFKLAMTPDNIKPLLENAKEVYDRLDQCIKEVQALLNSKL